MQVNIILQTASFFYGSNLSGGTVLGIFWMEEFQFTTASFNTNIGDGWSVVGFDCI
jgi:hypothetical protein